MISIREQSYGLSVTLYNDYTKADFLVLEEAILKAVDDLDLAHRHRLDLLLDLSMMKDFTLEMAWEQLKFVQEHKSDFGRVAVVSNDFWIKLGAHLSDFLTGIHPHYFTEITDAQEWLLDLDPC